MFRRCYERRRVIVTGHTGFKGSWLCAWLAEMGAEVTGYALQPETVPNHLQHLDIDMNSVIGDVCDVEQINRVFREYKPEIVFHLAAQAIVRLSYKDPARTFSSNVMGTVSVLEAARKCGTVRAIVNVTSDKCYENREWPWGYREIDFVGGYDPYSASKGCAELITGCWRSSFFNLKDYGKAHQTLLASCRAGNVIGGGDWAVDRLIPDLVRAASQKVAVTIRYPEATRPWQHVLEPLSGYLLLGQMLLEGHQDCAEAWNFGPPENGNVAVKEIVGQVQRAWPEVCYKIEAVPDTLHEAGILNLDCSKARARLRWMPVWDVKAAVERTILWYRAFYESDIVQTLEDLRRYISDAEERGLIWAKE